MSLRCYGARQFECRPPKTAILWAPTAAFITACSIPFISGTYATVYTIVNVMLTALTLATAIQHWPGSGKKTLSRWGLIGVHILLAASFAVRAGQGLLAAQEFGRGLPDDLLLAIHLIVALFFLTASGALSLSLAYEKNATRLFHLATRDALTGLLTRRALEDKVREIAALGEFRPYAVLIFDLDHFKQVNDLYGHAAGDATLKACADIFTEVLGKKQIIARWGGEEFIAIVETNSPVEAHALAERSRMRIKKASIVYLHHRINLSVSIGICHSTRCDSDFKEMLLKADSALYKAKAKGRNRTEAAAA
ncbi:GGDEF domain-containing protein [Pelagibacterium luteolum]|uniref:diguanylate cyclase n=1 Tax=Pelagibacterium luteolum TaxID=440168 RepID=A0A1G8AH76_9HYPH|nr:GGDEF domain-containing protein [Pelagibacterium luteolum]SDH20308.1 diguanylate cyclase (GGDEF) domain-containing protein [Pelagibacterium luteolum]